MLTVLSMAKSIRHAFVDIATFFMEVNRLNKQNPWRIHFVQMIWAQIINIQMCSSHSTLCESQYRATIYAIVEFATEEYEKKHFIEMKLVFGILRNSITFISYGHRGVSDKYSWIYEYWLVYLIQCTNMTLLVRFNQNFSVSKGIFYRKSKLMAPNN